MTNSVGVFLDFLSFLLNVCRVLINRRVMSSSRKTCCARSASGLPGARANGQLLSLSLFFFLFLVSNVIGIYPTPVAVLDSSSSNRRNFCVSVFFFQEVKKKGILGNLYGPA